MARRAALKQIEGQTVPKTAEGRTVKHGVSRLLPYMPPWLMWLGVMGIALTGWALWGESPWYPVATWTAHLGAMGVSRKMTRSRPVNDVLVLLALASILGSGLLSVMVGVIGPNSTMWSLWGGVGFSLCMYWTIRRLHLTGDMKVVENATSTQVQKIIDSLNGAKPGNVIEHETGVIEIPVEVNRGEQAVDELNQTVRDIEAVTRMRPNAGKLVPSDTDAGAATMKFYPQDKLKGLQPWQGPSAFGESVSIALPVARRLDYTTVNIHLTADHKISRAVPQFLVMGMNGSGKSAFFRMLAADLLTRKDVTLWMHDHVKGLQTLKPILQGLQGAGRDIRVSMSLPNGKRMVASVRDAIRQRARWLGLHDFDEWEENCGLNLLVVWLEEANELGQLKDLIKLVKEGRSAGVVIFISMQRASYVALDTETRAQLSGNVCFGVESYTDASFGLSDHIRDRGAEPERWKNNKQGYCYIEAPGISDEEAALEARTFFAEKADIIDAIKRGNVVRRTLEEETDQVTINACRKWYEEALPVDAFLPGHPLFAKATGLELTTGSETDNESGLAETDGDHRSSEPVRAGSGDLGSGAGMGVVRGDIDHAEAESEAEAEDDIDEDAEDEAEEQLMEELSTGSPDLPPVPNVKLAAIGKPVEELDAEECQARVQIHLAKYWKDGKRTVNVPMISAMTPPIRYKREWIRNELKRLSSGDADARGYRLHADEDAPAGTFRIVPPDVR